MDDLAAAFAQAAARIRAEPDPVEAYDQAMDLLVAAAQFRGEAAVLRSETAARIRDEGGLSIAQLGQVIGREKATAAKVLRRTAGR